MADIVEFPKRPVTRADERTPENADNEPEPLWRSVLGARLRRLRCEKGYSLTRTARRAGISPQYLSEIERGLKEPSSEMVAAVAGALDTTLFDIASQTVTDLGRADIARRADIRTRRPSGPVALAS